MIKGGALVYFFLVTSLTALAQDSAIDSLKNRLSTSQKDSSRVKILNELAFKYLAYQPQLAKQHAEEALSLAKEMNFISGEIKALDRLGEFEFRQSNYARSVEYTSRSLKLAEQAKDSLSMANAYRTLGNSYTFGFKRYDYALQYQLKAFEIYERRKDKRSVAAFCGNITWIYAITNKNLKEAHRLADLGIHLSDSLHDNQYLSYNYNSKGLIFMQQAMPDSALQYLDLSMQFAQRVNDKAVIAYNKSIIGNIYLRQHNIQKAIELFNAALTESRQLNLREVQKDSYGGLAKGYEALSNFPLAYRYHVLFTQLKDSLVNLEVTQRALMAEIEFKEASREAKIAELEHTNQQAKKEKAIYIVLFGIVFLSLTTVIILVTFNNRNRAKANQLLEEKNLEIADQNRRLKQANAIKDKLFSIIGHDLRSPLVSLKGLLSMVVRNQISDEEFKAFAPKLNQLVMSSNETLENLLQWSHSQMKGWNHTPATFAVEPLIKKILILFADQAKAKQIILQHTIDKNVTVFADVNQVELIFRNLIHNAIKFTPNEGSVNITAAKEGEWLKISFLDTGIGMSAEQIEQLFEDSTGLSTRGTQGERGTGLGLTLCKEMAKNNGGYLSVVSEARKGSAFCVFLKSIITAN
jgi:two-component system, sensor histidine kinase and response regulator